MAVARTRLPHGAITAWLSGAVGVIATPDSAGATPRSWGEQSGPGARPESGGAPRSTGP
ncbi:hypothetical protein IscW_ISCW002682 [Ixodes scapularis]|uniref:Uncharacterized protein n=1 Tax=Ixodes scapularis TaxID=6945 RepID=B7PD61_IXOSC|nr:hypothetical protein IscW_ISCW002682 [Ixodes scapularis]|eukprot:XP_002410629.1 hypothetical protein IscW_ISCW002682 [Ixodes scapularis]